jgi:hypothetical protein
MVGAMLKATPLLAIPATTTSMFPEAALAGTGATIVESLHVTGIATNPSFKAWYALLVIA